MVRCEMWYDVQVKCGAMWNVAISDMVRLKCKICDVEYGVVWNMVSWYVECCLTAKCGKLRCDVVMKNVRPMQCVKYAVILNVGVVWNS